jgi:hypothetical protein
MGRRTAKRKEIYDENLRRIILEITIIQKLLLAHTHTLSFPTGLYGYET